MKLIPFLLIGLFVVTFIPPATSLGGTKATEDWVFTAPLPSGYTGFDEPADRAFVVDADLAGNWYVMYRLTKAAGGTDSHIISLDSNGGQRWGRSIGCGSGSGGTCNVHEIRVDLANGRLLAAFNDFNAGTGRVLALDTATGATIEQSGDFRTISPNPGGLHVIDSKRLTASSVDYFLGTTSRLIRFSQPFENSTATDYSIALPSGAPEPKTLYVDESRNFAYMVLGPDGTNVRALRINQTNGAITNDATVAEGFSQANRFGFPGQLNSTRWYLFRTAGTAASTTMNYHARNITTWTEVVSNQGFTPGQIWTGGTLFDTDTIRWDIDGQDNFLACGTHTGGNNQGFIAHLKTSNNTQHWNISFDYNTGAGTDHVFACRFNYQGNFLIGQFANAAGVTKIQYSQYSGGGFSAPNPRATANLPSAEEAPLVTEPGDAAGGIVGFAEGIGFQSEASKILFGLILIAIAMVASGKGIGAFGGGKVGMAGAVVIGVGMAIFLGFAGLWPAWPIIILALLGAAFVTFVNRRIIGGFGG